MKEWALGAKDYRRVLNLAGPDPRTLELSQYLHPASINYFSELNPIFSYQVHDPRLLAHAPKWLMRDGLVSLMWFFRQCPEAPKNWKGSLLVYHKFINQVPAGWQQCTRPYRLRITNHQDHERKRLLILGNISDLACSLDHLKMQLVTLQRWLDSSKHKDPKPTLMLNWKQNCFPSDENFHANYLAEIFKCFPQGCHWLELQDFLKMDTFKNFQIVELNDAMLCADSFVVHHALSYEGALLSTEDEDTMADFSNSEYFPVSPYHGFEVPSRCNPTLFTNNKRESFEKLMRLERRMAEYLALKQEYLVPWPKGLIDWASSD